MMDLEDSNFMVLPCQPTSDFKLHPPSESSVDSHTPGSIPSNLTLCFKQIKLTKPLKDYIDKKLHGEKFLKISWSFRHMKDSFVIPTPIYESTKVKSKHTGQYPLEIGDDFIKSLDKSPIMFDLYVTTRKSFATLSTAELSISDILDNVNKKERAKVLFYNNKISHDYVAKAEVRYKLLCNKKKLKEVVAKWKLSHRFQKNRIKLPELMGRRERCVNYSQEDSFCHNLLSSLQEAKTVSTLSQDDNAERDEVFLTQEGDWKDETRDIFDVKWKEWMEQNDFREESPTRSDDLKFVLSITVSKVYFLEKKIFLKRKSSIEQIYVEFSFLDEEGPEMETPFSLPVGYLENPTEFNWTKTFEFNVEKDYSYCSRLANFVANNEPIRFVVISEPKESLDSMILTCEEVGFADVSLKDIVEFGSGCDTYQYEILDCENPLLVLGYIMICFDGIVGLKNLIDYMNTAKKVRSAT